MVGSGRSNINAPMFGRMFDLDLNVFFDPSMPLSFLPRHTYVPPINGNVRWTNEALTVLMWHPSHAFFLLMWHFCTWFFNPKHSFDKNALESTLNSLDSFLVSSLSSLPLSEILLIEPNFSRSKP